MRVPSPTLTPELSVTDYVQSLSFYTKILEFEILYTREEEGFAMLHKNGADLMIDQVNIGRSWKTGALEYPFGRGINLQIEVSDVTTLYKNVIDQKWPIFVDMEEKWYRANDIYTGNKQFLVQDPDGYLLRFFEDLGEKAESEIN